MKIKKMFAAALAASMLLTACNSKTGDNSQENNNTGDGIIYQYTDFLDYTFDGNYTIAEPSTSKTQAGTEYEQTVTNWEVTYKDKSGEESKLYYRATDYIAADEPIYMNKENHDLSEIDSFVVAAVGERIKKEFVENIASKYMELQYDPLRGIYICPDIGDFTILCYPPVFIGSVGGEVFDKSCEITEKRLTVGSGLKVVDADIKNTCSNDEFTFTCQFVINQGLDKEKYIGIMEDMMKDFEEYTGTPMNYNFFLAESGNPQWLMKSMHLLGNQITEEQIDSGEVVYADDLKEHIFSKY